MPSQKRKASPTSGSQSSPKQMPMIVVGGHTMEWDRYWAMLRDMEKRQEPFKKWIEGVLPEYESHLKNTEKLPKDIVQKLRFIAEMFFDRVLQVGFLDFGGIRPEFIDKEFPHWWPTHVMSPDIINSKEVRESLKKLTSFIKNRYTIA